MAVSLLATEASFPEWIRPGIRFDGIRNTLRCNLDVIVELGLAVSFTVAPALGVTPWTAPPLTLFPPLTLPPFRMFFPPFPLPLPEAAAPNPDTND